MVWAGVIILSNDSMEKTEHNLFFLVIILLILVDKSNSSIYNDKIVMYNISYYTNYKSINNNQISTNLGAFFAFFKHRRSFKTP